MGDKHRLRNNALAPPDGARPGPARDAGGWRRAALTLVAIGWTANEFTVLLDVYRRLLGLSQGLVVGAFVVYVFGIVPGILLGGPVTDRLGRKKVVVAAIAASGLSSLTLMAGSEAPALLYAGRMLAGLAIGAAMTSVVVWSRELHDRVRGPDDDPDRPARWAGLCLSAGFALSGLCSALVAQWLPHPLLLAYVPQLALAAVALAAAVRLPETAAPTARRTTRRDGRRGGGVRPFLRYVVPLAPWVFAAPTIGYVVLPHLVAGALGEHVLLYSGLAILVTPGAGALMSPFARRLAARGPLVPAVAGMATIAVGLLAGSWAVHHQDPLLALAASAVLGCGYGLCVVYGLTQTARLAGPDRLAALTGIYWALAYIGFTAPFVFDLLDRELPAPGILLTLALLTVVSLLPLLGGRPAHAGGRVVGQDDPPYAPSRPRSAPQVTTSPHSQTLSGATDLDLPEFDTPPADPVPLLLGWLDSAVAREVREPYAAVLATADAEGRPSTRVLLVKDADASGLVFTSFTGSRKGRELAARPWASLTFYWRETLQQLTVSGPVEQVGAAESDALFARRPLAARATTSVSRQSRPLTDERALRERATSLVAAGTDVPRPGEWTGYRLIPTAVEFWYGSPDRLHRRLRYDRPGTRTPSWTHERLQP
ncbi:phenazine biosynthesis FMN-dependent oxidase PhzG [Streptomyces sp. NPDC004539]|uniref:phenazine biosynthesis FMN-dependent oxidase PhzG n=1 Tax=Streptomyces sp. NPDC004539 TaxID=3154280 RepID=UPI0033A13BAD